ncbi:fumarylacetoacetate hydrolase family protein [Nakamurella leprariae]|uniref:Fumarylacetoacetate hydrolase family protein n=1 Tax=Nakamurella leprariae TaxID=2803911 RepID=A0A938YBH9_9ACTN|nr:fumarylacetoacetate hydrolase family protein [Nakamurella leprariae]MBM9466551.1 fumarylacetoacetate hydrolase family protein [Nakamurella leprariae]
MRWATYRSARSVGPRIGLLHEGELRGVRGNASLAELLAGVGLEGAASSALADPAEVVSPDEVRLLAPIPRPPSIRDFMAFENHVVTSMRALGREVDPGWYEAPVFYFTNPAATRGPYEPVPIAPGSAAFDYELEVAAVIGRAGSDLHPDRAEQHIAGYVVLCDWSARDLQEHEMLQSLGPAKGKDTATSFSGYLVTPDELEPFRRDNGFDLAMTASVNGMPYSRGSLAELYWSFGEMLAYASRGTTLLPGDVIGSGTVGTGCILELARVHGAAAYPWLRPGDEVHLAVESIGSIDATIRAGADVIPLPARAASGRASGR